MYRRALHLVCAAAGAVALVFGILSFAGASSEVGPLCERAVLSPRPGWTISGAWTQQGHELVIVDSLYNQLLRYSESGRWRGNPPGRLAADLRALYPNAAVGTTNGMYLKSGNDRLVRLSSSLTPSPPIKVLRHSNRLNAALKSMFLWHPLEDSVLVYGDISTMVGGEERWRSGFVAVPLDESDDFEEILTTTPAGNDPSGDPSRLFYRLGLQLMTDLDGAYYFVLLNDSAGIYRYVIGDVEPQLVAPLPVPFTSLPKLPPTPTSAGYAELMKAVEGSTLVAGLYGWQGSLYLLGRNVSRPDPWYLYKYSPAGELEGFVEVDSSAHHLTVVPGPERWAFLEKGPVVAYGRQATESILFAEADGFRGELSGRLCE